MPRERERLGRRDRRGRSASPAAAANKPVLRARKPALVKKWPLRALPRRGAEPAAKAEADDDDDEEEDGSEREVRIRAARARVVRAGD